MFELRIVRLDEKKRSFSMYRLIAAQCKHTGVQITSYFHAE